MSPEPTLAPEREEVERLLVIVGVDDPQNWRHVPLARLRAAIYRMRLERKGKGALISWLKHPEWHCPDPPEWWDPWDLRPLADQQREHAWRIRDDQASHAAVRRTRQENEERFAGARPISDAEAGILYALMERLLDQMTPAEIAVLTRLREERVANAPEGDCDEN